MKLIINEQTIIKYSLVLTLIISLLLLWQPPVAMGLLLGGLIANLLFRILTIDVTNILRNPSNDIQKQVRKGYIKRYILTGLTLIIAITNINISFIATLVGLLIPKLVIFILYVLRR